MKNQAKVLFVQFFTKWFNSKIVIHKSNKIHLKRRDIMNRKFLYIIVAFSFFFISCNDNSINSIKNFSNNSFEDKLNKDNPASPYLLVQGTISQNASENGNSEGPNPPPCSVGIPLTGYELAFYYNLGTFESDTVSFNTFTQNSSYPYCGSIALQGYFQMGGTPTNTIYDIGYKIKSNNTVVLTGVLYTGTIPSKFYHNFNYSDLPLSGNSHYTLSFYVSGNQ